MPNRIPFTAIDPMALYLIAAACLLLPFSDAGAATPVIVSEARVDRFDDRVDALGTLRANESVTISSSITETVHAIHFDDGDRVKAGQLLVELTNAEQQALLEEARATASEAQRQYERVLSLHEQRQAPLSLVDERQRESHAAQARTKAIEARISVRMLKAPFAGVLGFRNISVGALVEPGDIITTLDDDSAMKLEFPVPSIYLGSLRLGLPVVATTRAYGMREFSGEVTAISSRIDPVTRSVMVRALLPNPDGLLRPGLLMHVGLSREQRENIVLPEEVLTPQGDRHFVMVVDEDNENKAIRREVRIGSRRPGEVEIIKGLNPGEKVISHGTMRVSEGDRVTIVAVDDGTVSLQELLEMMP